jgi:hypothetical protein
MKDHSKNWQQQWWRMNACRLLLRLPGHACYSAMNQISCRIVLAPSAIVNFELKGKDHQDVSLSIHHEHLI